MRSWTVALFALAAVAAALLAFMHLWSTGGAAASTAGSQRCECSIGAYPEPGVHRGPWYVAILVYGCSGVSSEALLTLNATAYAKVTGGYAKWTSYSKRVVLTLTPLTLYDGATLIAVPAPPVQVVRFNTSNGLSGYINVTAVLDVEVNTTCGGRPETHWFNYTLVPEYRINETTLEVHPLWVEPLMVTLLNQTPVETVPANGSVVVCGVALGLRPRFNLTLYLGGRWVVYETGLAGYPASQEDAAAVINETLSKLLEDIYLELSVSQHDRVNYTGPAVASRCISVDASSLGLGAGSALYARLVAGKFYSSTLAAYIYNSSGRYTVEVVDPSLEWLLWGYTPNATFYTSTAFRTLPEYNTLSAYPEWYRMLRENFTSIPLPHWELLGRGARLRVWTGGAMGGADVVVYASPILPPPWLNLTRLEDSLARGVLEGRYSLIVTGPVGIREYLRVEGNRVESVIYEAHSMLLQAVLGLYNLIYLEEAAHSTICAPLATLYTPPLVAAPGSLVATRYATLIGLHQGYSVTIETPIGRDASQLGFRAYSAPDWLFESGYRGRPLSGLTSDAEAGAARELLGFYSRLAGANLTGLAEWLQLIPMLATGLYTASWSMWSINASLPGCGAVYAPLPAPYASLAAREPPARPILVGPHASVVTLRALCSARRYAAYSSIPLQLSEDGASLLSLIAAAASKRPRCYTLLGYSLDHPPAWRPRYYAEARLVLVEGGGEAEATLAPGRSAVYNLTVYPLDYPAELRLYINGSPVKPLASKGPVTVYRVEGRIFHVTVVASNATPEPQRVLLVLEAPPAVETTTTTVTSTVTTTKTVVRNVTIPAATITKTVYVTETVTRYRTMTTTKTETIVSTTTLTTTKMLTTTVTRVERVTATKTVTYNRTLTAVSTTTVEKTVVTTKLIPKTVVRVERVTLTLRPKTPFGHPLLMLGIGLAAGVAAGFFASRIISTLRGGGE